MKRPLACFPFSSVVNASLILLVSMNKETLTRDATWQLCCSSDMADETASSSCQFLRTTIGHMRTSTLATGCAVVVASSWQMPDVAIVLVQLHTQKRVVVHVVNMFIFMSARLKFGDCTQQNSSATRYDFRREDMVRHCASRCGRTVGSWTHLVTLSYW